MRYFRESATSKNKKSEEFRDIIRNARKFQQEDKEVGDGSKKQDDKSAKKPWKRGREAKKTEEEVGENKTEEAEKEKALEEEKTLEDKGFKFLKRKTKAVVSQKVIFS